MSLKYKAIFILAFALILFVILFSYFSRKIILDGFLKLEKAKTINNIERVHEAYLVQLDNLSSKLSGWAIWDDTYQFIQDGNKDYVESNLQAQSLANLHLDIMVFINSSNEIVKAVRLLSEDQLIYEVPESLLQHLTPDSHILIHNKKNVTNSDFEQGLVLLPEGPFVLSSRAIYTSTGQGPPNGTLLFGYFLTEEKIEALAKTTKFSLHIHSLNTLPSEHKDIIENLKNNRQQMSQIYKNESEIEGITILNDINNKPSLLVDIDLPRDIFQEGKKSVNLLIITGISIGIFFIILQAATINHLVLSKIIRLSNEINSIKSSNSLNDQLTPVRSNDEIGRLVDEINLMLQAKASAKKQSILQNTALEAAANSIVITDIDGKIIWVNDAVTKLTGFSKDELVGNNPRILKSDKHSKDFYTNLWTTIKSGEVWNNTIVNKKKDGLLYTEEMTITPVKIDGTNITNYIAIKYDVTEKMRIKLEMEKHSLELQRINQLMVGREIKMIELKKEIELLKNKK